MMRTLSEAELHEILERHRLWLHNDPSGKRAELIAADLRGVKLVNANLSGANLFEANLSGADLRETNLSGADLRAANLYRANLSEANLSGADLRAANLYRANLSEANLSETNLSGANLFEANLSEANLSETNLSGANLFEANLSGANLRETNITYPIACPERGSFIAFKKAGDYIVELLIPENAKRCSATTRKCRCDKAMVVSITKLDGSDSGKNEVRSQFDSSFIYKLGEYMYVDNFEDNRWEECAPGIHFFITRQEAVNY